MRIYNKKARFNYVLSETFEAGIALNGAEAKILISGRGDISNAYVKIISGEAYLINANIPSINIKEPTRTRKLLLHKGQITSIESKMKAKKLTLIPIKLYNTRRLIKAEIALAKPKKTFEKRESIKKHDIEREIESQLKGRIG